MQAQLSEEEVAALRTIFNKYDKNNDNSMCVDELGELLKALGSKQTPAQLQNLLKSIDSDGNKKIDFSEYVAMMARSKAALELMQTFRRMDKDNNGTLCADEVREAVKSIGMAGTDGQVNAMITQADKNNDGKVNYQEFVDFMTKL